LCLNVDLVQILRCVSWGKPEEERVLEGGYYKVRGKLSTWEGKKLTFVGRVCLIKAIFIAIPLYYFSMFRAWVSACKEIISLQRRFLWS